MRVLLILFSFVVAAWGQMTIVSYLKSYRYSLANYLDQTGLTATLNGTGNYTLFAPITSAFYRMDRNILNDTAKFADVLKYHVVKGSYRMADLAYNEYQLPSLQGSNIRINNYYATRSITAEGQRIYSTEKVVSNGIIHLLYGVMTPPVGTVLDIVSNNVNLTTLLNAVQAAGLDSFLQDQTPITLFAPTNKAFEYLGATKVQALLKAPQLLASILKYHVIPGTLYAAGYHTEYMHTFEEADRLVLGRQLGGYEVENGQLNNKELSATNGVVHQVDQVLIPASLSDQINALTTRK